jgi:RNA polymerase subunit RPABC4/transcription elongation factor Spt4
MSVGTVLACARCGSVTGSDDDFCTECGVSLKPAGPITPQPPALATPPWKLPRPIALIGGIAIASSSLLPWVGSGRVWLLGYGVPFRMLLGHKGTGGFSIGLTLLIAGASSIGIAFIPRPARPVARVVRATVSMLPGIATTAVASTVIFRANQSVQGKTSVGEILGAGVYVALVGAALSLVSRVDHRRSIVAASIALGLAASAGLTPIFITPSSARAAGSPAPTATQAADPRLAGMLATLDAKGYTVARQGLAAYEPGAAFNAVVGIAKDSAMVHTERVFFFAGSRYLGIDATAPSASISFGPRSDDTIAIDYSLYNGDDAECCPLAGVARVSFRWDGAHVRASGHFPTADPAASFSRR